MLRVEYQYFDGSEPDVIEFCPVEGEDARYAAVLNGGYNGLLRKTCLLYTSWASSAERV